MTAPVQAGPSPQGGGRTPSSPVLSPSVHKARGLVQRPLEPRGYITGRQVDILRLAANGNTNRAIARHLGVGEETVKTQLQVTYRKLRAKDRTQAVAVALRVGLLSMTDVMLPPGLPDRYMPGNTREIGTS